MIAEWKAPNCATPEEVFRLAWAQERVDRLRTGGGDINEVEEPAKWMIWQRCLMLISIPVHVSRLREACGTMTFVIQKHFAEKNDVAVDRSGTEAVEVKF